MDYNLGRFGDVRLDRTAAGFLARMVARSTVCVRRLGVSRGGVLRYGRFLASPRVTVEKIIASWAETTRVAAAGRHGARSCISRAPAIVVDRPRKRKMATIFFIRGLLLVLCGVDLEPAYRLVPAVTTPNANARQPNFIKRLAPAFQGEMGPFGDGRLNRCDNRLARTTCGPALGQTHNRLWRRRDCRKYRG